MCFLTHVQVKYFDVELRTLKEEVFRGLFHNFGALKQMPVPRSKEAFLDATPYFELWKVI